MPETIHSVRRRGFTSISRWMPGLKPYAPSHQGARASRPYERHARFSPPTEDPPPTQNFPHHRHRYLVAREAFAIGILTTLFLVASIACELTSRSQSLVVHLLIPAATFLALHLLCIIASLIAKVTKPDHRDIAQGVVILTLFSGYAVLRVLHPLADWFTPIAWFWIALITVDLVGRIIERIKPNRQTT